jgi:hypothetical protein
MPRENSDTFQEGTIHLSSKSYYTQKKEEEKETEKRANKQENR